MARYAGRKGVVYMSTTGAGTAVLVANLNKWSLNMQTDKIEVTAFGDANKVYVQGMRDVKGSISGFFDDTDDSLYDTAQSTTGGKFYLYPSSDAPSKYFYGTAWTDFNIDTTVAGAVTVSGDFAAAGSWGQQ